VATTNGNHVDSVSEMDLSARSSRSPLARSPASIGSSRNPHTAQRNEGRSLFIAAGCLLVAPAAPIPSASGRPEAPW